MTKETHDSLREPYDPRGRHGCRTEVSRVQGRPYRQPNQEVLSPNYAVRSAVEPEYL